MKNIVLIGMPGTGKSTVGVILAKRLGYDFLDTDILLARRENRTLPKIIEDEGLDRFLELEGEAGLSVNCRNTVIATGGSMVFSEAAMEELTGIKLRRCELTDNTIEACGVTFDLNNENKPGDCHFKTTQDYTKWHQLSPVFYAENLDVVLGRFKENGKPAVGLKFRPDGSFDAFCANVPIPTAVLREIFTRAGIFLYADRPTAVYTNASFACVYSIEGGDITLYRPQQETFIEHFSGERISVGPNGTTVHFEPQTTKVYVRENN